MKIHHLDCGTMCPISARLVNGRGGLFSRGQMVCHCLLIELGNELVLVDTGFGIEDVEDPRRRLGRDFLRVAAPKLERSRTALGQLEQLGFRREDVRHIVPTHLDPDHAGGLSDFPEATVHVFEPEKEAALAPADLRERLRYRRAHFAHGPRWQVHTLDGETWSGFRAVQVIAGEVALIPLLGHTRGHCGVAVRDGERHLLHAGDAYFHHGELEETPRCPPGLAIFQRLMANDNHKRLENRARLGELARDKSAGVRVFSAHDPDELRDFA